MQPVSPSSPAPSDPARSPALLLLVAALLVLIATTSKSWISIDHGGDAAGHFGPLGLEECDSHGNCMERPAPRLPGDLELVMTLAVIGGFATAGLAGWAGLALFAGRGGKVPPPKLQRAAFSLAAGSFAWFTVRSFSEGGASVGPGWAMFVGIVGAIMASIALKKAAPFFGVAHPTVESPLRPS